MKPDNDRMFQLSEHANELSRIEPVETLFSQDGEMTICDVNNLHRAWISTYDAVEVEQ